MKRKGEDDQVIRHIDTSLILANKYSPISYFQKGTCNKVMGQTCLHLPVFEAFVSFFGNHVWERNLCHLDKTILV